MSYNINTYGGNMNSNEITIKINFSDSLLNKRSNLFLISNNPMPVGIALPNIKQEKADEKSTPIGFKN